MKLRCKHNSISNFLKDVFCYNSFSLDFRLQSTYLLIQQTYWTNFYLKKSKGVAVTRPKKLKNAFIASFISEKEHDIITKHMKEMKLETFFFTIILFLKV